MRAIVLIIILGASFWIVRDVATLPVVHETTDGVVVKVFDRQMQPHEPNSEIAKAILAGRYECVVVGK